METSNRPGLNTQSVEPVIESPECGTVKSSTVAASNAYDTETTSAPQQAQPAPSWLVASGILPPLSLIALSFLRSGDSLIDIVIDSIGSGDHRPV